MSNRSLPVFLALILAPLACEAQYRNYSLRCLAPIIETLDASSPKTLQDALLTGPATLFEPLERIGANAIDFPISTNSEEAQRLFDQGIALFHVLWYKEAERAFRTVVELDPECPMGYWGLAQANERAPQRARVFAEAARDRCDRNRPELEQRWITLLADYYSKTQDASLTRGAARIEALEELALDFPDSPEVQAFLIRRLTLDPFVSGLPVPSTLAVDSLAEQFARRFPRHPSRHYQVFLWMERRPSRHLDTAVTMTQTSPGASEVWSYAAEAHASAGRSAEAIELSEAALRVDWDHLAKRDQLPWQSQNVSDNLERLVNLLIGAGRIEEAVAWTKRTLELPRQLPPAEAGAEILWMRARLSAGQWEVFLDELANDSVLNASQATSDQAMRLSWRGIVHLALGQESEAAKIVGELVALERSAIIEGVSSTEEISIAQSRNRLNTALRLFSEASEAPLADWLDSLDLPPLVLARLLERFGRIDDALSLLRNEWETQPYQWLRTAVFCRLAERTGHEREARFPIDRRFRTDASHADESLAELGHLDVVAQNLGLPIPWKYPPQEIGFELDLDQLGPKAWEPPMAPPFERIDRLGNRWTLEQFDGRPLLIHFFLGVQCAFCLDQFDAFQPHLADFSAAGIELLAISIDDQENLRKFLGSETEANAAYRDRLPFPVLADPDLVAFRNYGVFDEFENGPMHATILVAPDGKILWRNIAHTPFKDPAALVRESSRLLEVHHFSSRTNWNNPSSRAPAAP